jgi:type VI secretion system protein VasD
MLAKLVGKNPAWLFGLLGVACGHGPAPCPAPESIPVILRAGDQLNSDESGQALPTTIRLYQLKDAGRLSTATLEQMLENDRALLGEDLLSVKEITLYPGEAIKPVLDRRDGATTLAVVAFFLHPKGSGWRAASPLPPPDPFHCHAQRSSFGFALVDGQINVK